MPSYTAIKNRLDSINRAASVLSQLQTCYHAAKTAQGSLQLYQAGTDQTFNDAIDAIFTGPEKQEMNQMLQQIDALVTNWEANHGSILEIE